MSFKIEELIIYLDSGIKKKDTEIDPKEPVKNVEPVKLTSKMIYHPEKKEVSSLNDNPFITPNVRYDSIHLKSIFKNKTYSEILKFFFNKNNFKETIKNLTRNIKIEKNLDDKEKISNVESNIRFMLSYLFPTTLPGKNNIISSFDEYIMNNSNSGISFDNSFKNKFSYLKIDSKVYTISKIYILDDIVNNPFYAEIIESYKTFLSSGEEKTVFLTNKLVKKLKVLLFKLINNNDKKYKQDKKNLNILKYLIDNYDSTKKENIGFSQSYDINNKKLQTFNKPGGISASSTTVSNQEILVKNLKIIVDNITNLINYLNYNTNTNKVIEDIKNDNIMDTLDTCYTYIKNIVEAYELISSNSNIQLGIDNDFEKDFKEKIKVLNKEITNMNYMKKLITQYLSKDTTSLNINDDDDKEFVEYVKKEFPIINSFVDKLKNNIIEKRKSSNESLQDIIQNFYEKEETFENLVSKDKNNQISFGELINHVNEELVEVTNDLSFFKTNENKDLLDIGINLINKNDPMSPQYEIYLATDLIEGELNDTNINNYKCVYRDQYLATETKNMVDRKDAKYNVKYHRIFIPEQPKVDTKPQVSSAPAPAPAVKKKGGRKTKKNFKFYKKNFSNKRKY